MGRLQHSRPWPVLPPSPFGLRRTSRDGAARLLGTRLRVSMAGFVVNNNESTRPLLRHARACPGHPRLGGIIKHKGVDGRDIGERSDAVLRTAMPGHDGVRHWAA